jgi:dTDP-glucose pyrophosphorylase
MVNIVIPMAGLGSRFRVANYKKAKPFITIQEKAMIMHVLDNLAMEDATYYLIALKHHIEEEPFIFNDIKNKSNVVIIPIDSITEGPACTALYAREYINNANPLLIANCDQIVDMRISDFISDAISRNLDGSILTFYSTENKWSYAKINENQMVIEVKEKEVISEFATVGIYYFKEGREFVNSGIDMIVRNERVNQEFYVTPIYSHMIAKKQKIGIYNIDQSQMHGTGTPEDLEQYLMRISR